MSPATDKNAIAALVREAGFPPGVVNVVPGLRSFYRWEGAVQDDAEVQLLIKTQPEHFDDISKWLKAHHPYEVPELVALPADKVSDTYLEYISPSDFLPK